MPNSDSEGDVTHSESDFAMNDDDEDVSSTEFDSEDFENADSDESNSNVVDEGNDAEDSDAKVSSNTISLSKLAYIKEKIKVAPTIKLCKELVLAFKSAVQQADGFSNKTDMSNSELFNDVIKLCLLELVPALRKILKLPQDERGKKADPSNSKKWKRLQLIVKSYLIDMLKFFPIMKESSVLVLLLKHIIHLLPFYAVFIKLCRNLLKKIIVLWCSDEDTVRVLSLIVIVRASKSFNKQYLGQILKQMYLAYVRNTKFTSPSTWPMINFMKRSLTEVYSINPEIAYEQAFIYIRQLSIHLRNAITTKKKEAFQTVYNWQCVHCLVLWSHLLCRLHNNEALKTLIYPLVQTIIGTINLIPTARYVPLRFHLIKALMYISKETGTYIPILPFILDVLTIIDYNKKSNFSAKPIDFSCALKVTKSQLFEAGFKDACITEVCNLLIDYLKIYSCSIGFPELALPAFLQIKNFIKKCKVSKYNQQLKVVLNKVEENSLLISEKRKRVTFQITDDDLIKKWEEDIQEQGTPIMLIQKNIKTVAESLPPNEKIVNLQKRKKNETILSKKKRRN